MAPASEAISHTFINNGSTTLQLSWGDSNYDTYHGPVEPGSRVVVGECVITPERTASLDNWPVSLTTPLRVLGPWIPTPL